MKIKTLEYRIPKNQKFMGFPEFGRSDWAHTDSSFLGLEPFKFKIFGPICLGLDYLGFLHTLPTLVLTSSELLLNK